MFIQVIQGTVSDPEALKRSMARWMSDIKPGAIGYLGSTGGITPDGRTITLARFESEEAAQANSARPEQAAWWDEASKAYADDVTFHDCREVDTGFGGGSDKARFVQVIQGRSADPQKMRELGMSAEDELRKIRPDILGFVIAWHGDGGFTQAVYFTSEEAARAGEQAMQGNSTMDEITSLMQPEAFFDLPDPQFD
ncbi:MAG TPA: hypothetical protein VMI11_14980 [Actinomycetes bacterium]|nr:hypothetical protein [Actinomycetes bacterium]